MSENEGAWENFWANLAKLKVSLKNSKSAQIESSVVKSLARGIVQDYFRVLRQELSSMSLDVKSMDDAMQELLRLSNSRASKVTYMRLVSSLPNIRHEIEVAREKKLGESGGGRISTLRYSKTEEMVINTLQPFLPRAAASYQQVLADLSDSSRLSFRGTAAELREIVREVLDQLAPDQPVMKSEGFKLDSGRTGPTMKQKVRFVLRSRGLGRTVTEVPEQTASIIEDHKASVTRATYERGSLATHVAADKDEAEQLKRYVEAILCELLEIR